MGLRYRNGEPLYGKTLQTVLAERPTPGDRRRRARARAGRLGADGGGPPVEAPGVTARCRPSAGEGYQLATRIFSVTIIGFGLAILVVTLARGGGPQRWAFSSGWCSSRWAPGGSTSRCG